MRQTLTAGALMLVLALIIPWLLVGGQDSYARESESEQMPTEAEDDGKVADPSSGSKPEMLEEETVLPSCDAEVTLKVLIDGELVEKALDDYLWEVAAAEMPASFALEALKAQVSAARTYTLYRMANPNSAHPNADICTDSGCCQAWISREARLESWGSSASKYEEKLTQAVSSTDGMAIYYDSEPILAVFHASSAGYTKSAEEVWGSAVPYLVEVESPEGAEVPNYYSTVTLSLSAFREAFLSAYPDASLEDDASTWLGETVYDDCGALYSITIGGVNVRATQLRTLFNLRSASFELRLGDESATFYVTGYGHGVGMSQYGANALAAQGKTYVEILEWYYPGAAVLEMG